MTTIATPATPVAIEILGGLIVEQWRALDTAYTRADNIDTRELAQAFNAMRRTMETLNFAAHLRAEGVEIVTLASGSTAEMTQAQMDDEARWNDDGDETNYWNAP